MCSPIQPPSMVNNTRDNIVESYSVYDCMQSHTAIRADNTLYS
jgi:hypothetical protein